MINFLPIWQTNGAFWPSTMAGWVTLVAIDVIIICGAIAGLWRTLRKPIDKAVEEAIAARKAGDDIEAEARKAADDGIGKRIAEVAQISHNLMGKIDIYLSQQAVSEQDRALIHERLGALGAHVTQLATDVRAHEVKQFEERGKDRERIVRLETKLGG